MAGVQMRPSLLSKCAALIRLGSGESGYALDELMEVVSILVDLLDTAKVMRAVRTMPQDGQNDPFRTGALEASEMTFKHDQ